MDLTYNSKIISLDKISINQANSFKDIIDLSLNPVN